MQMLYQRIERQLEASSLGALPLTELVSRLRDETLAPPPDLDAVLAELRRWPDRFRVVDPWGPGIDRFDPARVRERGVAGWKDRWPGAPLQGAWAVLLSAIRTEEAEPPVGSGGLAMRLRESLQHLARVLDLDSVLAVARWARLATSSRDTDARLSLA